LKPGFGRVFFIPDWVADAGGSCDAYPLSQTANTRARKTQHTFNFAQVAVPVGVLSVSAGAFALGVNPE
jgi:hypothetical protein